MKTNKYLRLLAAVFCCVISVAMVSCDDDDDDAPALKFSSPITEVVAGNTVSVTVSGGTEPYKAVSADEKIATAAVSESTITLTGVAEGKTLINVTDKNNMAGKMMVVVKKAGGLSADKTEVEVGVDEEASVNVKGGTAPYSALSADAAVATATVKDGVVTVKGVKAGKTQITVADKDKKNSVVIAVTVK